MPNYEIVKQTICLVSTIHHYSEFSSPECINSVIDARLMQS